MVIFLNSIFYNRLAATAAAAKSLQSCPTLSDPMDCSFPGPSVYGILQLRILECIAMPFSRGSSQLRTEPASLISPALASSFFTTSTTSHRADLNYRLATRSYCLAQGILNVTWQPGWEGSLGKNGYMYVYGWVPLLSTWTRSVAQSCPTLCDPMNRSTPGLPVHHQLPELAQIHVHWVDDAIQPSHLLSSPFLPAFNLSQHQGLF